MYLPPSGVIRDFGPHFDQALDQPVHGLLNFFHPDIELPDHMQEVVGQNPHLQPGLDEHLGPPEIAYYSFLYHLVMLISGNSCGIIQVNVNNF